MATMSIAYVSAVGDFVSTVPSAERERLLARVLERDEAGEDSLCDAECAKFTALCDLHLKILLQGTRAGVNSLRAELSYGWPEYRKGWFRVGCELMVDRDKQDRAVAFLLNSDTAAALEYQFEQAAREVLQGMAPRLFARVHATFYLHEEPIWDS